MSFMKKVTALLLSTLLVFGISVITATDSLDAEEVPCFIGETEEAEEETEYIVRFSDDVVTLYAEE